ncbi:sensor domain-containing protein [Streptomyces rimosus]|uniref:sensor domain-containing protein n=1 Tax=Streptomyces rimosus TaxID=1927 RepID=UPI0037D2C37C
MFARPRTFASSAAVAVARCQLASLDAIAVSAVGSLAVLALLLMPVGVGFRLLPPAARALRVLSDRARSRAGRWTGVRIAPPPPLPRTAASTPARGRARSSPTRGSGATWRGPGWSRWSAGCSSPSRSR